MANLALLMPLIEKWEGGYAYDPDDPGGPTFKGITLETWKKAGYDINRDGVINLDDLRLVSHEEMMYNIVKPFYWDMWQADLIQNQSIANVLVDWLWCSGPRTIKIVQHLLGVKADGIVGNQTLAAINKHPDSSLLHFQIKAARKYYINSICEQRPALNKFKRGWKNRIADFMYAPILVLCLLLIAPASGCRSARATLQTTVMDSAQHSAVRLSLSDSMVTKIESDKTTYRDTFREQLVESMHVFLRLSGYSDTLTSCKPLHLSGIADIRRVTQSEAVRDTHRQQERAVQDQQGIRQGKEEIRKSVVKKTMNESTCSENHPDKRISLYVFIAILFTCFFLLLYIRKR